MIGTPLVIDFPHSGLEAPTGWQTVLSQPQWMRSADLYVDELWAAYRELGIPAAKASFPRVYLDVNRAPEDFDPDHFIKDAEVPAEPGRYAKLGMGLVWMTCGPENFRIYAAPPTLSELDRRLREHYRPYHRTLQALLEEAVTRYGGYVFLDLHSMPAVGDRRSLRKEGEKRPDCIIGTLDGRSADPALAEALAGLFTSEGLKAAVDDEFKGGYLVRRYGQPELKRHAIQIEVNRGLYLAPDRMNRSIAFPALQERLGRILRRFNEHVKEYFL